MSRGGKDIWLVKAVGLKSQTGGKVRRSEVGKMGRAEVRKKKHRAWGIAPSVKGKERKWE